MPAVYERSHAFVYTSILSIQADLFSPAPQDFLISPCADLYPLKQCAILF